ncbi:MULTISPECIES: FxsA family protein [unclassified Gordonia (in: high G+C Gram-positive bacteria)]|uniref:FxsA family protein n=1 Tax=unclassified Gordonia (in: high G+C Gram-positive bacteria) TaxID=2657482 RepID=UPI001F11028A|nr:FxsA family protein [Gordonia sp. ABSL49_1]MCH5642775.1 FxsA family protein [Gordonia sp. ABSL49_1]
MRLRHMFFLYVLVELAAFVAMALTLGFGWAVLISLGAAVLGLVMLQWQGRKVFGELRRATRNEVDPAAPLADSALLALATILLIVPGVVTTVAGVLMLAPPLRKLARPAVVALGARRAATAMDRAGIYATGVYAGGRYAGPDVIDGTVVDASYADERFPNERFDRQLPQGR